MTRAITLLVFLLLVASLALAQDPRYGGPPERDADGNIKRSRAVLREFQRIHPCPSTGLQSGSCPGWFKDHVIPLVCGGADSIVNLQWMPGEIKTCAGTTCKDRWERRVYCRFVPPTTPKE
ncbi:HNH endonuclease signature motif containing protein [Hydrogenophaga sp.]|uniref:HNH endonuclease signature motif containing protein n=1 Tax=Hydrogenophaga sp. TaxID=1904254 RepID=UPI0025BBED74|nr:HNH endonuclease signature motif containing protein [Hydrogenophaga sp.]